MRMKPAISKFQSCEALSGEISHIMLPAWTFYYRTFNCQAGGNLLHSNRKLIQKSSRIFWNSAGIKAYSKYSSDSNGIQVYSLNYVHPYTCGCWLYARCCVQASGHWGEWANVCFFFHWGSHGPHHLRIDPSNNCPIIFVFNNQTHILVKSKPSTILR